MRRSGRVVVTATVLAALVGPVVFDRDSFPLSTYPMYARTRTSQSTFVTAYGIDDDGRTLRLSPTIIGDSDDPLIVAGELRAAVREGRSEQRCSEIADRAGSIDDLAAVGLVAVEVVSERHDTVERTAGRSSLIDRHVVVTCAISTSDGAP